METAYHFTYAKSFKKFSKKASGSNTNTNASDKLWAMTAKMGFWFTANPNPKGMPDARRIECNLEIKKPFETYSVDTLIDEILQNGGLNGFREWLKKYGYDGIVVENDREFEDYPSYIVFDNSQITIINA